MGENVWDFRKRLTLLFGSAVIIAVVFFIFKVLFYYVWPFMLAFGAASEADSGAGETFKGEKDSCCEYSCNNGDAYNSFSAVVCRLYGVSRT